MYRIRGYACTIFSVSLSSPRARIDKNRLTLIAFQVNTLQAVKLSYTVHGLRKLFRRHTDNLHVINMVSRNVVLRRRDRRFGDFRCQYAIEVARQGQRELPLPQYSSSKSPVASLVASSAHSSIWIFMAAFG